MPISGSLPRSGLSQHIFHAVQNIKKVSDISVGERKQNRDHDDIDVGGVIDAICWHFFSLPSASWRNRQLLTTRKRHIRDMQTWRRSPCTIGKNAIFLSTRVFKAPFKLWTPTFQSFTIDSFVCYFRSKIDVQSSSGAKLQKWTSLVKGDLQTKIKCLWRLRKNYYIVHMYVCPFCAILFVYCSMC